MVITYNTEADFTGRHLGITDRALISRLLGR